MSFNFYLLKGLRLLLFPFSLIMAAGVALRNRLYDWNILKPVSFNLPMICVGNLSAGGTGKSPMTELLISMLHKEYQLATLSRGYKRKTKGYLLAGDDTTALEIGDEPMQFHLKYPHVAVAVGEERVLAVPQLLHDRPQTQLIILDDAFQHRSIKAGLNIILTEFSNPYWDDWFLPTGDLRDERRSAQRADMIVVTKCPAHMDESKRQEYLRAIAPAAHQQVFFATLEYGVPYHINSKAEMQLAADMEVLLVCGIANPAPLKAYVEANTESYKLVDFADHHIFSLDDMRDIRSRFDAMEGDHKIMLTTEKDAVRLVKYGERLNDLPLYVIPVRHRLLFEEETKFRERIIRFVHHFNTNPTL